QVSEWVGVNKTNRYTFQKKYNANGTYYIYAKDDVGNINKISFQVSHVDKIPPKSSFGIQSSMVGNNGWYKSLSIKVTASDGESGVSSAKYCVTTESSCTPTTAVTLSNNTYVVSLGSNTSAQKVCSQVIDNAENISAVQCSSAYKVDGTGSSSSFGIQSSTVGNNGWYKALSIKVSVNDSHSGVSSARYCVTTDNTCTPYLEANLSNNTYIVSLGNNANAQKVCSQVTDLAGNVSGIQCSNIYKIDGATPRISYNVHTKTDGNNNWYKALSIKVSVNDSHSGGASAKYCVTTGSSCIPSSIASLSDNTYIVSFGNNTSAQKVCSQVTDKAGNISGVQCSATYKVDGMLPTNGSISIDSSTSGSNGWYRKLSLKVSGFQDSHSGIVSPAESKYCITTEGSCTPNMVSGVRYADSYIVTLSTNARAQKVCWNLTDRAGNTSLAKCSGTYQVDEEAPRITSASISSTASYNNLTPTIQMNAWDETEMSMCISNTGYENGCSYQQFSSSKVWNVGGSLDGGERTIYITVKDLAGNKTNKELKYRVYQEENPDDYDWSKSIACNATKLKATFTKSSNVGGSFLLTYGKFKDYIEHQQFRNALYDCAEVSQPAIRGSSWALKSIKESSRIEIVNGYVGQNGIMKNNDDGGSMNPSLYANNYMTNLYTGRAFILSSSLYSAPCYVDRDSSDIYGPSENSQCFHMDVSDGYSNYEYDTGSSGNGNDHSVYEITVNYQTCVGPLTISPSNASCENIVWQPYSPRDTYPALSEDVSEEFKTSADKTIYNVFVPSLNATFVRYFAMTGYDNAEFARETAYYESKRVYFKIFKI
ncbi:MAG: hypothetical protein HFH86_01645, partial [Bacilli bacterium]|nr:hypothetical protein [Bacilli bacterium]